MGIALTRIVLQLYIDIGRSEMGCGIGKQGSLQEMFPDFAHKMSLSDGELRTLFNNTDTNQDRILDEGELVDLFTQLLDLYLDKMEHDPDWQEIRDVNHDEFKARLVQLKQDAIQVVGQAMDTAEKNTLEAVGSCALNVANRKITLGGGEWQNVIQEF